MRTLIIVVLAAVLSACGGYEIKNLVKTDVDLVTDESTASTLSSSNAASDAILAIQTFDSPKNFNEFTKSIDIGVRISESLVVGSGGADTSPFSIRFSVE